METGRREREKAQCQGGQLDGNKAVVDGNAVDPHVEQPPPHLSHIQTCTKDLNKIPTSAHLHYLVRSWLISSSHFHQNPSLPVKENDLRGASSLCETTTVYWDRRAG